MPELLNEVVEAADKLPGVRIRGLGANLPAWLGPFPPWIASGAWRSWPKALKADMPAASFSLLATAAP